MKKKILTVILGLTMALFLTACQKYTANFPIRNAKDSEEDIVGEGTEDEKDAKGETRGSRNISSGVVLGGDFDAAYDGFRYLNCENLVTSAEDNLDDDNTKSQELLVFIPIADYSSVNGNTAY